MSTYLVAFVVSDFEVINDTSPSKNILVEVAGRPSAIQDGDGQFALE
jgi:aminopeptidase N